MSFFSKYLSYFGFLEIYPNCIDPSSKIISEKLDKIISKVFSNYSSEFEIVFATLIFRKEIENKCLNYSVAKKKISLYDFFLIKTFRKLYSVIDLVSFVFFGFFISRYLNIKTVKNLKKNNLVVFEHKKRNYNLNKDLSNHGLLNIDYSTKKNKHSKYQLRISLIEYLRIIKFKLNHFGIKTSDLIKFITLKNGFDLFYKDLENEKNYKFFSQEGFAFSHRLFISFFKSKNFKTFIFFNNINYSFKIPQLSDYIILRSEMSKVWLYETDFPKIIVADLDSKVNKFINSDPKSIIKIAYLPEIHLSQDSFKKEKYLHNLLEELSKKTKKDVELIIRDHPQIYDSKKNKLKSIYSHFNSKYYKVSFDDHHNDFSNFIAPISCLFVHITLQLSKIRF